MKFAHISLIGAGTALEIYDSYVLSFMLREINQIFFPENVYSNLVGLATFGVLFLVRPIGAFFWGILGDKYGKFSVFKHAILFMAIATLSIGLLPTYSQVGLLAPLLLLTLRIIQGVSISGEFGSAIVLCYEQSSQQQRFANNGILYAFIFSGILIASAMTYFVNHSDIPSDLAWRIPFIFGGICGFIIYFIRRGINFVEGKHPEVSFKLILLNYRTFLIGACSICLINLNWLYFSSISIIFNNILNHDSINQLSIKGSIVVIISAFIFGKFFAYHVRHKMMVILYFSIITMYVLGVIFVNYLKLVNAMVMFYYIESIIAGIIFVALPTLIIDNLLPIIRNSIYNIANNISTAIMVGFMPFIINVLSRNITHGWLNYLLIINLVVSLISLWSIKILGSYTSITSKSINN